MDLETHEGWEEQNGARSLSSGGFAHLFVSLTVGL